MRVPFGMAGLQESTCSNVRNSSSWRARIGAFTETPTSTNCRTSATSPRMAASCKSSGTFRNGERWGARTPPGASQCEGSKTGKRDSTGIFSIITGGSNLASASASLEAALMVLSDLFISSGPMLGRVFSELKPSFSFSVSFFVGSSNSPTPAPGAGSGVTGFLLTHGFGFGTTTVENLRGSRTTVSSSFMGKNASPHVNHPSAPS
mmetsp:Transcript_115055/g.365537  ORF Transcript_115055/g.365537 Transcript_115055/m.365537 type:complete len:206 (+) Transcript_115055:3438-4055(+)